MAPFSISGQLSITGIFVNTGVPYSVVEYAMYYENILSGMKPTKNENDEYVLGE